MNVKRFNLSVYIFFTFFYSSLSFLCIYKVASILAFIGLINASHIPANHGYSVVTKHDDYGHGASYGAGHGLAGLVGHGSYDGGFYGGHAGSYGGHVGSYGGYAGFDGHAGSYGHAGYGGDAYGHGGYYGGHGHEDYYVNELY